MSGTRQPLPNVPRRADGVNDATDYTIEQRLTLESIKTHTDINFRLRSTYTSFTGDEGFRELVQNWKDGMSHSFKTELYFKSERNNHEIIHKAFGDDTGPDDCLGYILFKEDDKGNKGKGTVELTNRRSRLEPYHLDIGGTTKADDRSLAGTHGEGLKLALLVLQRSPQNHAVRCRTGGCSWSFGFSQQGNLASRITRLTAKTAKDKHAKNSLAPFDPCPNQDVRFLIGVRKQGRDETGQRIITRAITRQEFEGWCASAIFLQELKDDDIVKTKHGELILHPEHRGILYLKGLLMRTSTSSASASMTGRPLKYSYNFESGITNRDRRTLSSAEDEGRAILEIWQAVVKDRSDLVGELSNILNSSDPQWAEASMLKGGLGYSTAAMLAQHLLSDSSKWYYSARESQEARANARLDGIIASLGRQGFQLQTEYWDALAPTHLLHTTKYWEQRQFRSAVDVPVPTHRFAQLMERMLLACLSACPQTSFLKLGFVRAGNLLLQTFYEENDDERVRVHERWLHPDTAMPQFAFLGPVSEIDILFHGCKLLFKDIIDQLGADRFASSDRHASTMTLKEQQLILTEQRLREYIHQHSTLRLIWVPANSLVVNWHALKMTGGDHKFAVTLHNTSTCSSLKNKLLARDISDLVCTSSCLKPAAAGFDCHASESILYQAIFRNLKQGVKYLAIVSKPDKPASFVTASRLCTVPIGASQPPRFPINTRVGPQTPSYPFPTGQTIPQTHRPQVQGQGPVFVGGPPGGTPIRPIDLTVDQPPAGFGIQASYPPSQAFTGRYVRGNGEMGESFQKRQRTG